MIIRSFACVALFAAAACGARGESIAPSSNGEVKVERLTTWEGCVLYRVWDGPHKVYVVRCGEDARAEWDVTRSCGKSCSTTDHLETITAGSAG